MRAALSIVLAAWLIILPVEQVLAQAEQQEAVSVEQTAPSDGAASLFRVPPLTQNSARLFGTSPDRAHLDRPFAKASSSNADAVAGWDDWSNGKRALVVVGVIVVAYVVAAVLIFVVATEAANRDRSPLR